MLVIYAQEHGIIHVWTGCELQVIVIVGGPVMTDPDANSGLLL